MRTNPAAAAEQPHRAHKRGRLTVFEQQAGCAGFERGENASVRLGSG
jgi:hypothetical protein